MNSKFFDERIEEFAGGKIKIFGAVIGEYRGRKDEIKKLGLTVPRFKLLPWEVAKPALHYEWDRGYGAPECHSIVVWTEDDVIFVSQYDGSTGLERMPRSPCDCKPEMPGG